MKYTCTLNRLLSEEVARHEINPFLQVLRKRSLARDCHGCRVLNNKTRMSEKRGDTGRLRLVRLRHQLLDNLDYRSRPIVANP